MPVSISPSKVLPSGGEKHTPVSDVPDGGRQAWAVVLGSFLLHIGMFGYLYSFGVWIIPISELFDVGKGETALIGSIMFFFFLLIAPVAGAISDKYGVKVTSMAGTVALVGGLLLGSAANQLWLLYTTQGFMIGIAGAFLYFPGVSVVSQWFTTKRARATSLAAMGAGVGSFVYPVLVSNLISEMGVRAAMRVLGCIQLGVLIPATCLIKRFLPLDKGRKINLDTPAFKEHKFRKLFAMCGVFFMGFTVVIFFLPSYTISLGFTKAQGSLALTLFGAGNTLGRPLMGFIADKFGPTRTLMYSLLVAGVSTFLWPFATSMATICLYGIVFGVAGGAFFALLPVVCAEQFGVKRMGGLLPLAFFGALPAAVCAAPLAGWAVDATGKYIVPQLVSAAGMCMASIFLWLMGPGKEAGV